MFSPTLLLPVKLSFIFLYHRIFVVYETFTIACVISGILVLVQWLTFELLIMLECLPLAHFWDSAIPGRCLNLRAVGEGYVISSFITDFMILILPMPVIWQCRLSIGQKIGLTGIFMLGGL